MAKVVLEDVGSGYKLQSINANFDTVEAILNDKVLFRDNPTGEPNAMNSDLDMNGKRVYNLPTPINPNEAARLKDVQDAVTGITNANLITFSPRENSTATNVQAAIEELGNTRPRYVDNIAALRALPVPIIDTGVFVSGYATKYDEGDGFFVWNGSSTAAHNGGTVIAPATNPASGRWIRKGVFNAKHFGASNLGVIDSAAAINASVAVEGGGNIVEGSYAISSTINTSRGLRGEHARLTWIQPTANTFDAVVLTDTTGEFTKLSDFRVGFASKGTGDGVVLANINNNVEVSRIQVQKANVAFNAKYIAFMQKYQMCRADTCNTGFYANGLDAGGGGAGTTLVYEQCYGSNGVNTVFDLNNIRGVEMIQPTADMVGCTAVIKTLGVGVLNVFGHHFEGTPGGNGSYINYTTSGSLAHGITIEGGAIENANLSALTFNYLTVSANDDYVRVVLVNVNARNLIGGPNAKLIKVTGAAGSRVEVIAINCNFGPLEGQFDLSGYPGTFNYRKIEDEKVLLARGVTSVAGGGVISTGVAGGLDNKHVSVQIRTDDGTLNNVEARCTQTYSGTDQIQVKFLRVTDGASDPGTYPVQWFVFS